jgi:phosphate transport system protein
MQRGTTDMPLHLQKEIENLKRKILALGAAVETNVRDAVIALDNRDDELARNVISRDPEIDRREVEIEEDSLKALALHQPVAIDLRFIVTVLKINNDLERIGDLAVNIAERAAFLATVPKPDISLDFRTMTGAVRRMLRDSLDALVNLDTSAAQHVCAADDQVDNMNRQMYVTIQEAFARLPDEIPALVHLLSTSRHLERIADHATNIAEDVIYMVEGRIIRHRTEQYAAERRQKSHD